MTAAAQRQRYLSDLLRVTKPSELQRWFEAEVRAGRALHAEVSPWVERYETTKSLADALMTDDDRLLAFAKMGAEKAIDAAADAVSASATTPVLIMGKQYLQMLFDAIGSTFALERARKELQKAQTLAQSAPAAIAVKLQPYHVGGELIRTFQARMEAYAFGMSFLKGYLTRELLRGNPQLVLGEIGKMRRKYEEVEKAGDGINQLLALRIVLAQMHAAIRVSFFRYRESILAEGRRGGPLAPVWRSLATIAHQVNSQESLLAYGVDARSDKWMKSRIEDLIDAVDADLLAWLKVDAAGRATINKLDLFMDFRGG